MNSLAKKLDHEFIPTNIWFTEDQLHVALDDGREISVPLEFYPRLNRASREQREKYQSTGLMNKNHIEAGTSDEKANIFKVLNLHRRCSSICGISFAKRKELQKLG